ncbi:Zn-dependent exopeptidase, partial [Conidiobolus coronatus NRRL 28638]
SGTHFVDKTDDGPEILQINSVYNTYLIPQEINNKNLTERAHRYLNTQRAREYLTILSNFHTRFYNTTTGYEAALFIKSHAQKILENYKGKSIVEEYAHTWKQPSIIVRLPGTKHPDEIVILGAHLDSINQKNPEFGRSPGADDDGSGSA